MLCVLMMCSVSQSRQTLCDPMDCGPPGSSVREIFQAEILEWVAIFYSRDLPDPGLEPRSLASPALAGRFFTPGECHLGSPSMLQSLSVSLLFIIEWFPTGYMCRILFIQSPAEGYLDYFQLCTIMNNAAMNNFKKTVCGQMSSFLLGWFLRVECLVIWQT